MADIQLNWRKKGKLQQDKKAGTAQEAVRGEHTPSWARVGPAGGRPSRDTCSACRVKKMAPYVRIKELLLHAVAVEVGAAAA
ncbi:hypothetical protein V6N12_009362 [Hibiscus sabdariffa]|uniref:Uncharacterized protein n=1 Tax=Hibiscus sabdariffa TaxID=183260 RepID=A0ABR2EAS1_9ROSI